MDQAPPICLTEAEMFCWIGKKQSRLQIAWLAERGIPFDVSAAGRPKVARAYWEKRLAGGTLTPKPRRQPNLTPRIDRAA